MLWAIGGKAGGKIGGQTGLNRPKQTGMDDSQTVEMTRASNQMFDSYPKDGG